MHNYALDFDYRRVYNRQNILMEEKMMTLYDLYDICLDDFNVELRDVNGYDGDDDNLLFEGSMSDAVDEFGNFQVTSFYPKDSFSIQVDIEYEEE